MNYFIKFDGDLSSDTCALCAFHHEVVARVEDDHWYASLSVELRGFTLLQNTFKKFRNNQSLKSEEEAIRGTLAINAPSSDHWVEPLVDCTKQFTLDHTSYGQLIAYEGEILDDLQLVRDWWKFIKSLFSSETTKCEWQTYRQAATFVVDNCGTWDDKSLQRLLLLCQTAASLDPLFLQFPMALTGNQEI